MEPNTAPHVLHIGLPPWPPWLLTVLSFALYLWNRKAVSGSSPLGADRGAQGGGPELVARWSKEGLGVSGILSSNAQWATAYALTSCWA